MARLQKIILTRPVAQSQPLAGRLSELGFNVTLFPLLEIAPLDNQSQLAHLFKDAVAKLARYAMAAFVSPNAIHAVFQTPGFIWPAGVAIAVMGEGSLATLAHYGINDRNACIYHPADPVRSDTETLLKVIDLSAFKGRDVIIFRAESGRELLSDALIAKHIHVEKVASYRRIAPAINAENSQLLSSLLTSPHYWVVSSSEALRTLVVMTEKIAGEAGVAKLQQINLWVSHHRITESAEKCGFKHIRLIGSGDENVLLALQSQP